jgi:hypothetical protein
LSNEKIYQLFYLKYVCHSGGGRNPSATENIGIVYGYVVFSDYITNLCGLTLTPVAELVEAPGITVNFSFASLRHCVYLGFFLRPFFLIKKDQKIKNRSFSELTEGKIERYTVRCSR